MTESSGPPMIVRTMSSVAKDSPAPPVPPMAVDTVVREKLVNVSENVAAADGPR